MDKRDHMPAAEVTPLNHNPNLVIFRYRKWTFKDLETFHTWFDPECNLFLKVTNPHFELKCCESYTEVVNFKNHEEHGTGKKFVTIKSTDDCPIFVYDFGDWQKIYMPLAKKGFRFRYVGQLPDLFKITSKPLDKD